MEYAQRYMDDFLKSACSIYTSYIIIHTQYIKLHLTYIIYIHTYIYYIISINYIYMCVSLLGKLVMCCRYSCQNGPAILAQVFPLLNDLCRNLLCLSFAIMTAMEATSPLASESATLDSISLADAASSTGEDFLMLDTPRLLVGHRPVWECQA